MKRFNMTHKIAAAMTAGILLNGTGTAFAQATTSFKNVTTNIVDSSSTLPNLISTVAYIGGIGLGVAGIFKLKAHVDNPGQTPMKDGLVRLGAGGGLLALPMLTDAMVGTVGDQGTGPDVSHFDGLSTL
jgi:hypothetical protein